MGHSWFVLDRLENVEHYSFVEFDKSRNWVPPKTLTELEALIKRIEIDRIVECIKNHEESLQRLKERLNAVCNAK